MKVLKIILYCSYFIIPAIAESAPLQISLCGASCVSHTIPEAGCELTDTACQCSSTTLFPLTAACMLANCTMQETLVLSKINANLCHLPNPDHHKIVQSVFTAMTAVTYTLIALRLSTKFMKESRVESEDWILALSATMMIPAVYYSFDMSRTGFGKHLWSLEDGELLKFLRSFYIAENVYVVVLATTKLSILAFYLRIFRHQNVFRIAVYIVSGSIILSTVIISLLTIFQCRPIAYFWNRDLRGKCIDVNALAYANSAMSIIQDIVIVVLPIPVVWSLQISTRKKVSVGIMFALGGCGCIISIIRLRALVVFGKSIDPSWDYLYTVIWTGTELGIAMICASLPALRALLIAIFPRELISSVWSSRGGSRSASKSASKRRSKGPSIGASRSRDIRGKNEVRILGDEEDGSDELDLTTLTKNGTRFDYPKEVPEIDGMKAVERISV